MFCNKCNHKLPDDSEFCQYCGCKIEKQVEEDPIPVAIPSAPVTPVDETTFDDITTDNALNVFVEAQAKNTVEAMEANSKTQPNNEGDSDFGLIPEKPIFTLALMSVDGEEEYLNRLYTVNGEKIKYNRRGSISIEGINGVIDIYETFLPSGQPYKTIYINMYGAKNSTEAPAGFVLNTPSAQVKPAPKKKPSKKKIDIVKTCMLFIIIVLVVTIVVHNDYYQNEIKDLKDARDAYRTALESEEKTNEALLARQEELTREAQKEAEKYKNLYLSGGNADATNDTVFSSATDLLTAIKKNAIYYNNKEVVVLGTMVKKSDSIGIVDPSNKTNGPINTSDTSDSLYSKYQEYQLRNLEIKIKTKISSNIQYTVVETGDLVKITGKVTISNGEIYLNNCQCEIVATFAER